MMGFAFAQPILRLQPNARVIFSPVMQRTSGVFRHDPQTVLRQVPALFAQSKSEDREAAQSRHVFEPRRGAEARARRAIFQARVIALNKPTAQRSFTGRPEEPKSALGFIALESCDR
jgi:hypothetical protein